MELDLQLTLAERRKIGVRNKPMIFMLASVPLAGIWVDTTNRPRWRANKYTITFRIGFCNDGSRANNGERAQYNSRQNNNTRSEPTIFTNLYPTHFMFAQILQLVVRANY